MINPGQMNPMQMAGMAQQQPDAGIPTSQLTPEMLQQMQAYQDQQKRSQMAGALMQNQADPRTANAGFANAGSDILGAVTQNAIQHQNGPQSQVIQQRYGITPSQAGNVLHPGIMSKIGGLFSMGGGGS